MRLTGNFLAGVLLLFSGLLHAQHADVYVDEQGVMRWSDSQKEVHGFGVNYTTPFAHAYRSAQKLGIPIKDAIDRDVYHMTRLGFDAYRIHVWDTQISDTLGNLLENEHLETFDYMLKKMKDRGFRFLITPIAFWGDGWPEPDGKTPGFSHRYGKDGCLVNEAAIRAQENYLSQFLRHVNPYTGVAYKDDPAIVALEISNEPHHRQDADSVTRYIKKMVAAVRATGCEKPIFYNISHGIHLVDAYFDAEINGGTFQWYPTGLGAGEELQGNLLPNVDRYEIPFAENPQFMKGAKVVYEFDAADVGASYMYPAMARSFRTAGIQWATQFAYDPTFLAYANTEYNTHYLNLVYTPQKALSLKIAGEVFRRMPRYKEYGRYPGNTTFGDFRVSYEEDLSELVTNETFFYSHSTRTVPPGTNRLKEVAGYGNSVVVQYEGLGAYFLDQLEKGVWRLEVLPDAVWVEDPFGRNSLKRKLAEVIRGEWLMTISLPDLGEELTVRPMNEGNHWVPEVTGKSFRIRPGTYLVSGKGKKVNYSPEDPWGHIRVGEYTAPETTLEQMYVLHEPATQLNARRSHIVQTTVLSPDPVRSVSLVASLGNHTATYPMTRTGYRYTAEIPADVLQQGFLNYFISVETETGAVTYPLGESGKLGAWDFQWEQHYSVPVVEPASPLYLFDAKTDEDLLSRPWTPESAFVPLAEPARAEIRTVVKNLYEKDPENLQAAPIDDYSMRFCFKDKIRGRMESLKDKERLVVRGRSLVGKPTKIQVALITSEAVAHGGVLTLNAETGNYELPLAQLVEVKLVTLPRPYPSFLPYYFERSEQGTFSLEKIETLQISIGPGLSDPEKHEEQAFALEVVWLE